jgi:Ran-binding protein 1
MLSIKKQSRDSLPGNGKTFGENIEAPHSPVLSNNPSTKIVENITPVNMEKQENLITGEEDEEVILKAKTKLLQFEAGIWANKGLGNTKLMKHKETSKTRLVFRTEAGTVSLNMPIIPNMEVTFHQQRNLKFAGLNAIGEAPFKAGTFSLGFSVMSEKDEMYKHLNNAIATATTSSEKNPPETENTLLL